MERGAVLECRTRCWKRCGPELGLTMFDAIAAFFRGLFVRKDDNYKALLIADLGIER